MLPISRIAALKSSIRGKMGEKLPSTAKEEGSLAAGESFCPRGKREYSYVALIVPYVEPSSLPGTHFPHLGKATMWYE